MKPSETLRALHRVTPNQTTAILRARRGGTKPERIARDLNLPVAVVRAVIRRGNLLGGAPHVG